MDESFQPRLPAPSGPQPLPVVDGRYRVERLVARGGMATVYLAEHVPLRRMVALKVLTPPPDGEEGTGGFERRFRLEAETLGTLDHPNIVTLYDYGQADDGRFFLAMEYIDGPRYTDLIAGGALPPERVLGLLLQVCSALRYAHKRGVIHRDLKPSNLLLRTDAEGQERVKVVDFGLVKVAEVDQSLTREGLVLGSPHCMAPEQVKGIEVDHRADIYAIGVLLFRSLTGAYPFHGQNATATMIAHINEPIPTFASVAPGLILAPRIEAAVRRCLAKVPQDRFADATALMEELHGCLLAPGEIEVTQSMATTPAPKGEPTSRRLVPLLVAATLIGLAMIGGVLAWAFRTPPVEPPAVTAPVIPPVVAPPEVPAPVIAAVPEPAPVAPVAPVAPLAVAPAPPEAAPPKPRPTAPLVTKAPPVAAPVPAPVVAPAAPTQPEEKPPEGYMPLPDDFN